MPAEGNNASSLNLISGYPTGVSYRYVAETFGDKIREQRLQEKQMHLSLLDAEFFKVKRNYREVNVEIQIPFYHGVCEICHPNAREKTENYFVNILETRQLSLLKWAKQQFLVYPRLFLIQNKRCVDCSYSILKNEEFQEYVDQFFMYCDTQGLKYKGRTLTLQMVHSWTRKIAKNLSYTFSSIIFKSIAFAWYLISPKFMKKLIVSPVEVNVLKTKYCTDNLPFIYILQNQAKFDWFKVLFLLVFCQLKPPVIFLQREERPWLRWIYRKCGVIFYSSSTGETLKNTVHDEMFFIFIDENLKKNNHLMFYFNSSVEKDDRKLLDLIIDSIRRMSVKDVVIVPISICHEKVEPNDLDELPKFSIQDLFRRQNYNKGYVKVTFSQPFPLMEMIRAVGTKEECQTYDPTVIKYDGLAVGLVDKIYRHIAFDFCKIRALTSTNVVCYLLLTKFRNGIKLDDLAREVDDFRLLLKSMDKPVAFTGSSINVVSHALKLLNPRTVIVDEKPNGLIKPALKLPYITEISFYANVTLQFFMLDAVAMRALYTLRKEQLEDAFKNNKDISFFYDDFVRTAQELADILQFESPLFKPCRPVDSQIDDFLFKYVCSNYIVKIEKLMTAEEEWSRRVARRLEGFESDDDCDEEYNDISDDDNDDYSYSEPVPTRTNKGDEYQINYRDDQSVLRNIFFYKNTINYIIDAYLVSAENLKELIGKQITDSAYFRKLKVKMTMMLDEKSLEYPESVSVDTLRNSMKLFIAQGVVKSHLIDGIEVFYLSDCYDTEDKLQPIVNNIKKFH